MPSFSALLMAHIRGAKRETVAIDPRRREVVIANLTFLYTAVLASEQLLVDATAAADLLSQDDFNGRLVDYYRTHLEEERGHAAWLRDDLASVGATPDLPDMRAVAMVGTQYYLLKHVHPAALLGYMAVVEGDPTPEPVVARLEQIHGKELFRFVRFHARKDLEHRKELCRLIDRASNAIHQHISYSAGITLDYFARAAATWG